MTVVVPPAGAKAGGIAPTAQTSTPLWLHWLVIARVHAEDTRARVGQPYPAEFHAAMVAVSAAAFALEGLCGALTQILGEPAGKNSWRRILKQLQSGFDVERQAETWRLDLKWLFEDVRNPAVHHKEQFQATVPHPELHVEVSVEDRNYSAPNAERAVRIALDVVDTCFDSPKPETAEWVEARRPVVEQLLYTT